MKIVVTPCSGHACIEVADIGAAPDGTDWFRVRSTANRRSAIAVTGDELRAFLAAVKGGAFDEIAGA